MKQSFQQRRLRLCQSLTPNSIAILPAATITFRNRDVEHDWRQDSTFHYFTGIEEAQAILLISNIENIGSTIFCQSKDLNKEIWEGVRIGTKAMMEHYQMNHAFERQELDDKMPSFLAQCDSLYYDFGEDNTFDQRLFAWIKQLQRQSRLGKQAPEHMHFLAPVVARMRLYKDSAEKSLMREAGRISVMAHKKAMLTAQRQTNESPVVAQLEYTMRQHGSERTAFGSIVASGTNACTLHYRTNNQNYDEKALMLVDAGAEYQGYASDITTTFPVRGKFSAVQKAIYQAVLDVHHAVLVQCLPGKTFDDLHQLSCREICKQLINLGILQGEIDDLVANKSYRPYYMHRIGHWVGRDVHDVGKYHDGDDWLPLAVDMALTIEPGIYLLPSEKLDQQWWGIGVRIEDSILITQDGYENLTPGLPRTVAEIETFLADNKNNSTKE